MTWPLIILAVCSIFVGWTLWVGLPVGTPVLEQMLDYGEPPGVIDAHWAHWYALGCSLVIATVGIGLALALLRSAAGLPYFVPTRLSAGQAARAVRRALQAVRQQVVFRRDLLGRVRAALPGLRPLLRPGRQDLDRRPRQRHRPS